jgi:hypothetical protein
MAIRPVRRDEAASPREIRLRALGDAPQAYFASLESEEGLPLSYWEDWATSEDKVVFVAEEDGSWLGMAGAFVHPDKRGTVSLWWLWLAPSARHRSLADGWWTRGRTGRGSGVRSGSSWRSPRTTGSHSAPPEPRLRPDGGTPVDGLGSDACRDLHGPAALRLSSARFTVPACSGGAATVRARRPLSAGARRLQDPAPGRRSVAGTAAAGARHAPCRSRGRVGRRCA